MGWLRVVGAAVRSAARNDVLDWSAALAYYFLFSLFPTILLAVALLSALHLSGLVRNLIAALTRSLPQDAAHLVARSLDGILARHVPGLISVSVALLLYSGSQGFTGLMSAMNAAYGVGEARPLWRRMAVAIGLTMSAGIFIVIALALLVFGGRVLVAIAGPMHGGLALSLAWPLLRWGATLACMAVALAMLYRFCPNRTQTAGAAWGASVIALALWVAASAVLAGYLNHFSDYAAFYGSLGAVVALMLWFYLFALSLLLGAELHNAWLQRSGGGSENRAGGRDGIRAA